jgi:hypothetical protein
MEVPVVQPSGRTEVLYVAGVARSGSTLLNLLLGRLPGHVDVGETFYLWDAGLVKNQTCACGQPFQECPFWLEVGERAFGGWDNLDAQHVLALRNRVDATKRVAQVISPVSWSADFDADLQEYQGYVAALFRAVSATADGAVVVESSKRPSLATILRRDPSIDLRLVHLTRDPRGVAYSWSRKVAVPPGGGSRAFMKQRPARQIARRWVTVNLMFEVMARRGTPRLLLRYEDLAEDPHRWLAELAMFSGLDPDELPDPVEGAEGLSFRSHAVKGGRIRFQKSLDIRLDERWRTEMDGRSRRLTEAITWPTRRLYGYR